MTHDFNSTTRSQNLATSLGANTVWAVCLVSVCFVQTGCGDKDKTADSGYEAGDDSGGSDSDSDSDDSGDNSNSRDNGAGRSGSPPGGDSGAGGRQPSDETGGRGAGGSTVGRTGNQGINIGPPKPKSLDAESLDEMAMPENGTPQELFQYISTVMNQPARSELEIKERWSDAVTATQKILVHKDAKPVERLQAAKTKIALLGRLGQLGVASAAEHLPLFAAGLAKDKDQEIADYGRIMTFQLNLGKAIETKEGSFDDLATEVGAIAKETKPSPEVVQNLVHATLAMHKAGQLKAGRVALDSIVAVYSKDPQYKNLLEDMVERARYFELNLENTFRDYILGKTSLGEALRNDTLRLLDFPSPAMQTLQASAIIATGFERNADYDSAKAIYAEIIRVYANADIELKPHVETVTKSGNVRLAMVGQPLTLKGTTLQGVPFDWTQYKGKVVYVLFWSAGDGAFVENELPKLIDLQDVYKEQGLEFVGINIDQNVADVKNFFNYQSIPWPTIVGAMSEGNVAEQFGVLALPYALLVDAQGNVDSMHLDSSNLPEKLVRILGPPPVKPDDSAPENGETVAPPQEAQGNDKPGNDKPGNDKPGNDKPGNDKPGNDGPAPDPQKDEKPAEKEPADDLKLPPLKDINPYAARKGMNASQLVEYILRLEDRPVGLRKRPGFKEAVVEAARRVESGDNASEKLLGIAIEKKLKWLHIISLEDDATEKIEAMVKAARPQQDHSREEVRDWAQLIVLEAEVLEVDDLEIEKVKPLLERLNEYFADAELGEHHLRMASATIHAVNRIDVEEREEHFQNFGGLFQKSSSRKLASYGKNLQGATESAMSDLVGKPLEIRGETGLGTPIDWASYRGKYVLVDFWATWCGPCMRAAPDIRAMYDRHNEQGFDVVGINLDRDPEALAKYLDKENPPWVNVVGKDAKALAEELSVRGIPTMLLVDKKGKVIAASHSVSEIAAALKKAME